MKSLSLIAIISISAVSVLSANPIAKNTGHKAYTGKNATEVRNLVREIKSSPVHKNTPVIAQDAEFEAFANALRNKGNSPEAKNYKYFANNEVVNVAVVQPEILDMPSHEYKNRKHFATSVEAGNELAHR